MNDLMDETLRWPTKEDLATEDLADKELAGADITDDELTALALAADPEAPLDEDAVPLSLYPDQPPDALPSWYMPPAMARGGGRWTKMMIFAIIASFLVIDAFGLCITYGQLVAA